MKQRSYRAYEIWRDYGYDTEERIYRTTILEQAQKRFRVIFQDANCDHAIYLIELQVLEKVER